MPAEATEWKPTRHLDGHYQISVNYYHDNGRPAFDSVRLERYIALLQKGALVWQQKNTQRPEHNPSLEGAQALLGEEREYLRQKALESAHQQEEERPRPRRLAVIELPPEPPKALHRPAPRVEASTRVVASATDLEVRRQMLADVARRRSQPDAKVETRQAPKEASKPTSPSGRVDPPKVEPVRKSDAVKFEAPTATTNSRIKELEKDFDLDKAALRFQAMTPHNKELASLFVTGKPVLNLEPVSINSTKSALCHKVGIPKAHWHGGLADRMQLFRRVYERYTELEAMNPLQKKLVDPPKAETITEPKEILLLSHFRLLPDVEQDQVIGMLKALVREAKSGT